MEVIFKAFQINYKKNLSKPTSTIVAQTTEASFSLWLSTSGLIFEVSFFSSSIVAGVLVKIKSGVITALRTGVDTEVLGVNAGVFEERVGVD